MQEGNAALEGSMLSTPGFVLAVVFLLLICFSILVEVVRGGTAGCDECLQAAAASPRVLAASPHPPWPAPPACTPAHAWLADRALAHTLL